MQEKTRDKIIEMGFVPKFSVIIAYAPVEGAERTLLGTQHPHQQSDMNIYVYQKSKNDFVVLFPIWGTDEIHIDYYGDVDDIKEKIKKEVLDDTQRKD